MLSQYETFSDTTSQLTRLETVNWNFSKAKTDYLTHGLHPYPAKYIPQIPHTLIQELSYTGETVADIFCGSGTTLVEALLLKRNAIGIDANPLACLISEAKTTRFVKGDEEALYAIVKRANNLANDISLKREGLFLDLEPFISSAPRPLNEALSFWFEPFIIEELAEVLSWCRELPTISSSKVALAAFSSIIVSVSKQDSDTRYVRREKALSRGDVLRRFAHSLTKAIKSVAEFTKYVEQSLCCKVYNANILTKPCIDEVDLVVCSPPYPNAYSYHLYHMTRMLWLEMDQPKFKREEIGSHRKYSNKGPSRATIETFQTEMLHIFDWLNRYLRMNRFACFVIGNSTINGIVVDNAEIIANVAKFHGFVEVNRISRQIQDTKKAFNPGIGKIKSEQILLLQKQS